MEGWGNLLADCLLGLCLSGMASDDYPTRQYAKAGLWGLSQTGWRAPVERARASKDPEVRRLGREVEEALLELSGRPLPRIEDVLPPAGLGPLHEFWVEQARIREDGFWGESFDSEWEARDRAVHAMRQEMTRRFVEEAVEQGCPPFSLARCLDKAPRNGPPPRREDKEDPDD